MRHLTYVLLLTTSWAQSSTQPLQDLVRERFDTGGFPSLVAAVVHGDDVPFSVAHGFADRETRRRATTHTLYRIGSVTKVFTSTLLVTLRDKGVVRLDDPVAGLLPDRVRWPRDPRGAAHITLRHLATHSSGLPRNPVNMAGVPGDPWNGYSEDRLYAGLADTRLTFPTGASSTYSNLGIGLLGHALGQAAGSGYEAALMSHVIRPMGLTATHLTLNDTERALLATPYAAQDTTKRAKDWDLGCLAPAGGLSSSVTDLARFLAINLQAGRADSKPIPGGSLTELHTPQRIASDWSRGTGLAWLIGHDKDLGEVVWHNGGLAGFRSWVGFSPEWKLGAIVLTNCGRSVDEIGKALLNAAVKGLSTMSPELESTGKKLVPHFTAAPSDKLTALFSKRFVEKIPPAVIKNVFKGLHQKHGACVGVVGVQRGEAPGIARITFKFEKGDLISCAMALSDDPDDPGITYLRF